MWLPDEDLGMSEHMSEEQNPSRLIERLNEARDRIGKMCAERRPPSMSIPRSDNDDDEFIDAALADAIASVEQNRSLQQIVNGLPMSADGIRVKPGMTMYEIWIDINGLSGIEQVGPVSFVPIRHDGEYVELDECFASKDAAEAALSARPENR